MLLKSLFARQTPLIHPAHLLSIMELELHFHLYVTSIYSVTCQTEPMVARTIHWMFLNHTVSVTSMPLLYNTIMLFNYRTSLFRHVYLILQASILSGSPTFTQSITPDQCLEVFLGLLSLPGVVDGMIIRGFSTSSSHSLLLPLDICR